MAQKLTPQSFEMYSGDNKTLNFTVVDQDDVIQDITGAISITWAFARRRTDPPAVTKTLAGGGISIVDAVNGELKVEILQADTESLSGDFYHELQIVDNFGRKTTAAYGVMTVLHDMITT